MNRPHARARTALLGAAIACLITLTGCTGAPADAGDDGALTVGAIDLGGVCPATVVVQTDWHPESEHGHLYQLLGDDATIDAENKVTSGPLYAGGEYTGISLEIRAGGPAIGFQSATAQLYQDDAITFGYVSTPEAVQNSAELPTTAVFAPLEISPLMIMWDPETYPGVETVSELADEGAIVRYFGGSAYMDYLIGSGVIPAEQADGSFDGSPAAFIAAGGADGQQGYATSDPLIYGEELEAWAKPIEFQLIHDLGFPYYQSAMAVRSGELEELAPCLEALVPVLQQAEVDFFADPSAANALILRAVEEYDNAWVYTEEDAEYATQAMLDLGVASNGPDGALGSFAPERVQAIIDATTPIFGAEALADDLTAEAIATNRFIDPEIGLE